MSHTVYHLAATRRGGRARRGRGRGGEESRVDWNGVLMGCTSCCCQPSTSTSVSNSVTDEKPSRLSKEYLQSTTPRSCSKPSRVRPSPLLLLSCLTDGGWRIEEFACNGSLVEDEEMGQVIQLQGDQRTKIMGMLIEEGISTFFSLTSHSCDS